MNSRCIPLHVVHTNVQKLVQTYCGPRLLQLIHLLFSGSLRRPRIIRSFFSSSLIRLAIPQMSQAPKSKNQLRSLRSRPRCRRCRSEGGGEREREREEEDEEGDRASSEASVHASSARGICRARAREREREMAAGFGGVSSSELRSRSRSLTTKVASFLLPSPQKC